MDEHQPAAGLGFRAGRGLALWVGLCHVTTVAQYTTTGRRAELRRFDSSQMKGVYVDHRHVER